MDEKSVGSSRVALLVAAVIVDVLCLGVWKFDAGAPAGLVVFLSVMALPGLTARHFEKATARDGASLALMIAVAGVAAIPAFVVWATIGPSLSQSTAVWLWATMLFLPCIFVVLAWVRAPADHEQFRGSRWTGRVVASELVSIASLLFVPSTMGHGHNDRGSRARSDVANLGKAIARVRTDTGNSSAACLTNITANLPSPTSLSVCTSPGEKLPPCQTATPGYICWGGPYLPIVTNDPWNNPYTVTLDLETFAVTVFSLGKDGVPSADDVTFIQ